MSGELSGPWAHGQPPALPLPVFKPFQPEQEIVTKTISKHESPSLGSPTAEMGRTDAVPVLVAHQQPQGTATCLPEKVVTG